MKIPFVSIIILNFNSKNETSECLNSVLETQYLSYEVLIIDNGSRVNEAEILKKQFSNKRLHFIRLENNIGIPAGMNYGIRNSKADYIALLNNDTRVDPQWLSELIKVAKDKNIASVQAKIKSLFHSDYFDPSGMGGYIDMLGFPYTRGRLGYIVEKDEGQYDTEEDLLWGCGVGLLLKRTVLKQVGLLAEEFFYYHEDTDLCLRLKNFGYRIVAAPQAVIYHKGSASSSKIIPLRIFHMHRNNYLFLIRNLSLQRLAWVLPIRLLVDLGISAYYILKKKPQLCVSVVKAELVFLLMLPKILKTRPKQNYRVEHQMKPVSIIWEFIINKKRRYSELNGKKSDIPIQTNHYIYGNI